MTTRSDTASYLKVRGTGYNLFSWEIKFIEFDGYNGNTDEGDAEGDDDGDDHDHQKIVDNDYEDDNFVSDDLYHDNFVDDDHGNFDADKDFDYFDDDDDEP